MAKLRVADKKRKALEQWLEKWDRLQDELLRMQLAKTEEVYKDALEQAERLADELKGGIRC